MLCYTFNYVAKKQFVRPLVTIKAKILCGHLPERLEWNKKICRDIKDYQYE